MHKSKARKNGGRWKKKAIIIGLMAGVSMAGAFMGDAFLGAEKHFSGEQEICDHTGTVCNTHLRISGSGRDYGGPLGITDWDTHKVTFEDFSHSDGGYIGTDYDSHGNRVPVVSPAYDWTDIANYEYGPHGDYQTRFERTVTYETGRVVHYVIPEQYPAEPLDTLLSQFEAVHEDVYHDGAIYGGIVGGIGATAAYMAYASEETKKKAPTKSPKPRKGSHGKKKR